MCKGASIGCAVNQIKYCGENYNENKDDSLYSL